MAKDFMALHNEQIAKLPLPSPLLKIFLEVAGNLDIFRTPSGWKGVLEQLLGFCAEMHGLDAAKRIFAELSKPMTTREKRAYEAWKLLHRYESMEKPNVRELARQLAKEHKNTSGKRHGVTGISEDALDKLIRRTRKKFRRRTRLDI